MRENWSVLQINMHGGILGLGSHRQQGAAAPFVVAAPIPILNRTLV